jgi:hypothetical protein
MHLTAPCLIPRIRLSFRYVAATLKRYENLRAAGEAEEANAFSSSVRIGNRLIWKC